MHISKDLCRICLNNPGAISIYDKGAQITVIEAIVSITNINILCNDKLPNSICISCLESINSALKLCEDVKYAENKLKQIETDNEQISIADINDNEGELEFSVTTKHLAETVEQIQTDSAKSNVIDIVTDDEDESSTPSLLANVIIDEKLTQSNASEQPTIFEIESDEEEVEQSTLRALLLAGVNHTEKQFTQIPAASEQSIIIEDDTDEDERENSTLELSEYIEHSENYSGQIGSQQTVNGNGFEIQINDDSKGKHVKNYIMDAEQNSSERIINNSEKEANIKIKSQMLIEEFANNPNLMVTADVLICKVCGKQFLDIASYQWHMIISHDYEHFKCEKCTKIFTHTSLLKKHMELYCGKLHNCNICGKGFFRSYSMNEHIRTVHFKEKRFICVVCNKAFGTSANLRSHFRCLHIDDKPFQCKYCHSKFFRLRYLENHIARNHSIEPFN